jgi:hypothetical protein
VQITANAEVRTTHDAKVAEIEVGNGRTQHEDDFGRGMPIPLGGCYVATSLDLPRFFGEKVATKVATFLLGGRNGFGIK